MEKSIHSSVRQNQDTSQDVALLVSAMASTSSSGSATAGRGPRPDWRRRAAPTTELVRILRTPVQDAEGTSSILDEPRLEQPTGDAFHARKNETGLAGTCRGGIELSGLGSSRPMAEGACAAAKLGSASCLSTMSITMGLRTAAPAVTISTALLRRSVVRKMDGIVFFATTVILAEPSIEASALTRAA